MAAKKLLRLVNGKLQEVLGIVVSSGAPNDGDIPALGSDGKLDVSVLPTGVGPDVAVLEASENIGAGEYVNIFDDTGTPKIRKADNSNGRDAHGFLKTAVTTGNNGTVYFEGPNDNLTGLTIGALITLERRARPRLHHPLHRRLLLVNFSESRLMPQPLTPISTIALG